MNKKSFFIGVAILLIALVIAVLILQKKAPSTALNTPIAPKEIKPSDTFIEYNDPSGFSFIYPDNLSITNNASGENPDPDAYADLQLFSKDKSGSLTLKITDTDLETIADWKKANSIAEGIQPTEKKLGQLTAWEVKTTDRLFLAAIDQGILFTLEMPLIEQTFWSPVYDKLLTDFTFALPETSTQVTSQGSADEVIFEGEEVIE